MEFNDFRVAHLMGRYLNGTIDKKEMEELIRLKETYPIIEDWMEDREMKMEEIRDRLKLYMTEDLQSKWENTLSKTGAQKNKRISKVWWVAASLVAILLSGTWYVHNKNLPKSEASDQIFSSSVQPGRQQALLILSNGETVILGGKVNQTIHEGKNEIEVTGNTLDYASKKIAEVQTHQLNVPIGGTYQIQLNDGTKVWLNAESAIQYPSVFDDNERVVKLKGEAYFEVAKDFSRPFKVKVGGTTIEAVGTAFNINTHLGSGDVKTILTEGRVKVSMGRKSVLIDKGEQTLSNDQGIFVSNADMEEAMAWKDGYFYFGGKNLKDILEEVSRWYDLNVVYNKPISGEKYQGGIKRSESIQAVCAVLEGVTGLDIEIKNRTLFIK